MRAVEDRLLAVVRILGDVGETYHRWNLQGAREDGPVRRAGAAVRRDPGHGGTVQLHGQARCDVGRDQDHRFALQRNHGGIIQSEQAVEHPHLQILQVVQLVENHGVRAPTPHGVELKHAPLERAWRGQPVLTDIAHGAVDDLDVVEHHNLGIEDTGLDRTESLFCP